MTSKTSTTTEAKSFPVTYADIEAAAKRLNGVAHKTPVLTSKTVNERTNSQVFFKCENFQRTGSFKFRGAYNALAQLSEEQKQRGVLTFSSGNHAQGIALAGQLLGIPTTLLCPTMLQKLSSGYPWLWR
jgi:threonine dehydratase